MNLVKTVESNLYYVNYGSTTTVIASCFTAIILQVTFIIGPFVLLEENYPCNVL